MYCVVILLLLLAAPIAAQEHSAWLKPVAGRILLPDSLLYGPPTLPDVADSLWDYLGSGVIRLREGFGAESLRVIWTPVPLAGGLRRQWLAPSTWGEGPRPTPTRREEGDILDRLEGLHRSGTLIRGFTLGTRRDLALNSSLQLQASGKVSDEVELVALLSDQDLPIQPEGTTEELENIDQILLELRSKNYRVAFGDLDVTADTTGFLRLRRRVEGVSAAATFPAWGLSGAAAAPKGNWSRMNLPVRDGVLGPYPLLPSTGNPDLVVVAGTERIYLDGELLRRGQENQYTIDYAAGEVTFTPNVRLTSSSRVEIELQVTDEAYRRTLYLGRGRVAPVGPLEITTAVAVEQDDPTAPIAYASSAQATQRLLAAGDNPDSAYLPGATNVGTGQGNYRAVDSLAGHFEYVGSDSGDWRVSFSYAGPGRGRYSYAGGGVYRWVGPGLGEYEPVTLLPLPISHRVTEVQSRWRPGEGVELDGDLATSTWDANRASPRDDGDNVAWAGKLRAAWLPAPRPWRPLLEATWRKVDARFALFDRVDPIEDARDWGLDAATTYAADPSLGSAGERAFFRAGVEPTSRWSVEGNGGWLTLGPERRYRTGFRLAGGDSLRQAVQSQGSHIWSPEGGEWDRLTFDLRPRWKIAPHYDLLYERREPGDTTASRKVDHLAGLLADLGPVTLHPQAGIRREERQRDGRWTTFGDYGTASLLAMWTPGEWLLSGLVRRDEVRYAEPYRSAAYADRQNWAFQFRLNGSLLERVLSLNWDYLGYGSQTARLERTYLRVASGQGNYIYDPVRGIYISDPAGDYRAEYIFLGGWEPATSVQTQFRLRVDPRRTFATGFWSLLAHETQLSLETTSKNPRTEEVYLPRPGKLFDPTLTVTSNFTANEYLYVARGWPLSATLAWLYQQGLNAQYSVGPDRRLYREGRMTVEAQVDLSTRATAEYIRALTDRSDGIQPDRRITGDKFRLRGDRTLLPDLVFHLEGRYLLERDNVPGGGDIRTMIAGPEMDYTIAGRGRLAARFSYIEVRTGISPALLPYEAAGGYRVGLTRRWGADADVRLSTNLSVTGGYEGKVEPVTGVAHTFHVEARLVF